MKKQLALILLILATGSMAHAHHRRPDSVACSINAQWHTGAVIYNPFGDSIGRVTRRVTSAYGDTTISSDGRAFLDDGFQGNFDGGLGLLRGADGSDPAVYYTEWTTYKVASFDDGTVVPLLDGKWGDTLFSAEGDTLLPVPGLFGGTNYATAAYQRWQRIHGDTLDGYFFGGPADTTH